MSFNEDVKTTLSKLTEENRAAMEAEFYGFLQCGMSLVMKGRGVVNIKFETENAAAARKIYKLIKDLFMMNAAVTKVVRNNFGTDHLYAVEIEDSATCKDILHYYNMDIENGLKIDTPIEECFIPAEEEKRAYLRGVFLCCGYVSDPAKSYQMEFYVKNNVYAKSFQQFLSCFEIHSQFREKKNDIIAYIKKSEDISTVLALCGAFEHMLFMQDKMAMKEMRNKLQRIVNCETSNMNKTIDVALTQLNAINKIIREKGLGTLPDYLLETAQLRLDNPESSLNELSKLSRPPLSRSTLNKRLKKIIQIADQL